MAIRSFARSTSAVSILFLIVTGAAVACASNRFQESEGDDAKGGANDGGASGTDASGTGASGTGGSGTGVGGSASGSSGAGASTGGSDDDDSGGSGNDDSGGTDGSGGSGNGGAGGSGNDGSGGSMAGAGGSRGGSGGVSGTAGASQGGKAGSGGQAGGGAGGGSGGTGDPYPSCNALHAAEPALPSGTYTIRPALANAAFAVYCEMTTRGGGWTLAFNQNTSFVPTDEGSLTSLCYADACTNRSYSTVPIETDVMLDFDTLPISGSVYLARAAVIGVHSQTRGRTLRQLMTTGPAYLEREDNSNVFLTVNDPLGCAALPGEFAFLVCNECDDPSGDPCGSYVLTLGDSDSLCDSVKFAIGASKSYTTAWGNCSGWPPGPSWGLGGFPGYFRLWVR